MLYLFAFVYGVFAGGYAATWTGCMTEIQRESRDAQAGVVLGMMAATRGLGAVVGGPLSEELLKHNTLEGYIEGPYGTKFGILIIFTGITAILGGLGVAEKIRLWSMDGKDIESIGEIRRTHETMR